MASLNDKLKETSADREKEKRVENDKIAVEHKKDLKDGFKPSVLLNSKLTCSDCFFRNEEDFRVLGCEAYGRKPLRILDGANDCDFKYVSAKKVIISANEEEY
jgi:hypothetical protein